MTTPTVTELCRSGNSLGERCERPATPSHPENVSSTDNGSAASCGFWG